MKIKVKDLIKKMNNTNNIANMNSVVMQKSELLAILTKNKEAHDEIFEAALAGYWSMAREKIQERIEKFNKSVEELALEGVHQFNKLLAKIDKKEKLDNNETLKFRFDLVQPLNIVFPENHTLDYEKAIRKIQLSIYDTIELSDEDVERYVFNNWEWKNSFNISNMGYAESAVAKGDYVTKMGVLRRL